VTILSGLTGTNPRDFLASLGLLRIMGSRTRETRLRFSEDGAFVPYLDGVSARSVVEGILHDAASQAGPQPWRLEYDKGEKRGSKRVADLKPPPEVFRLFVESSVTSWLTGAREGAAYAASFATETAVDGRGNTKPTALHFTAANQQFLATVEQVRNMIDATWCEQALFKGQADRSGPNLRWDPAADRAYALMASDPQRQDTNVNAPLEWLAFRALPLIPVVPRGVRVETTGVRGRGTEMEFRWPLWSAAASLFTVASLVRLDWWSERRERLPAGITAICISEIRRTAQGFGNFGPARLVC
jgi:hypothetical protein